MKTRYLGHCCIVVVIKSTFLTAASKIVVLEFLLASGLRVSRVSVGNCQFLAGLDGAQCSERYPTASEHNISVGHARVVRCGKARGETDSYGGHISLTEGEGVHLHLNMEILATG